MLSIKLNIKLSTLGQYEKSLISNQVVKTDPDISWEVLFLPVQVFGKDSICFTLQQLDTVILASFTSGLDYFIGLLFDVSVPVVARLQLVQTAAA